MAQSECQQCGRPLPADSPEGLCPQCQKGAGAASIAGTVDDSQISLSEFRDASTVADGEGGSEASVEAALKEASQDAGRQVIEEPIAKGGMGEILMLLDRNTRRRLAMKRILPSVAEDPARRVRFVEEAQITAQLEHPNIVPVHDLDKDEAGNMYFTMKLVQGRSLGELLAEMRQSEGTSRKGAKTPGKEVSGVSVQASGREDGAAEGSLKPGTRNLKPQGGSPLTLSALLEVFLKVCDAIAYAHSRGVIHRDLKPDNIMVGAFGEVLVMDWGLAKIVGREDAHAAELVTSSRVEKEAGQTLDGAAMGTPAYMPPEQAEGEISKIDHRSDIYSLGAILYEMLALALPFRGKTAMAVMMQVSEGKVTPPEKRARGREIPRELSAVVMKCMQRRRRQRYQSVGELRKDISMFLEGRSVSAAPDTLLQGLVKLVKRNKGVSIAVGVALAVIIGITAAFTLDNMKKRLDAERARDAAIASEMRAIEARKRQRETALTASRELAEQAVRAAEQSRWNEAEMRADAALKIARDGPWGYYAFGVIAREKSDLAKAEEWFTRALELDENHTPSRTRLAEVQTAIGKTTEAAKLVENLDAVKDWRGLVAAGDTLYEVEDFRRAEQAYGRALEQMKAARDVPGGMTDKVGQKHEAALAWLKCEGFHDSIKALPASEQVGAIVKKLGQIHGRAISCQESTIEQDCLVGVVFRGLKYLQPFRGLPLKSLTLHGVRDRKALTDLRPLKGMPLTYLSCLFTGVQDLTPLGGMPLKTLVLTGCPHVSDLTPLKGLPLKSLDLHGCQEVPDLSALKGLRLRWLHVPNTHVKDLTPLGGMPLEELNLHLCKSIADVSPLKGMPLKLLDVGHTAVSDISALKGAPLERLGLWHCPVRDISPLKEMPLRTLHLGNTQVSDLTPLAGMKLQSLHCPPKAQLTPESLKVVENLKAQGCEIAW